MVEYTLSEKVPLTRSGMSEYVFVSESSQGDYFGIEDLAISLDVARTFGTFLRALLDREGIPFAEYGRQVGQTRGQITNITKGRRRPPKGRASLWADKLGLHGQEREDFIDLAAATYLPPDERARWWMILERLHSREAAERRAEPTPPSADPIDPSSP